MSITCLNCNNQMLDTATTCPKCNTNISTKIRSVSLLLGIGIFFLPVIFSWFTLRKGYTTKAKMISFIWVVIYCGMINSHNENKSTHITSINADKIIEVQIMEILSAYKNNEVNADNMYKGKMIQVTGIIDNIKKDILDHRYVTLGTGARFEIPQIQVFFDSTWNDKLGQLSKGQQLTITGRVDGLMGNVLVKNGALK